VPRRYPKRHWKPSKNHDRPWNSLPYRNWRKAVLKRDKFQCQWPGCPCKKKRKKALKVHHIRPWAQFPSLRYDVDNGITLCKDKHDEIKGEEMNYLQLFITLVHQNKKGKKKNGPNSSS